MRNVALKRLVVFFGTFLVAVALSASAHASSLRQGSTSSSANVTGLLPGEVLWAYYETTERFTICPSTLSAAISHPSGAVGNPAVPGTADPDGCNNGGVGDNILRLVNPNGGANGNLAGAKEQTVCAMIYVFDDDEEMGECCGCPLTSAQLATFSVEHNLTSNWGLSGGPENGDHGNGAIAIVAAAPNTIACVGGGGGAACHGGCDPTNVPGYSVTTASNLLGSVTHNQGVLGQRLIPRTPPPPVMEIFQQFGITETALSDDAGGDPTNLVYLQSQCGALIGNGTGSGVCNCPIE